ncbi:DUF930 domain-containing protein [Rhizobium sp. SSA_523]|uniref:DUF930 domain-containing protein n=1 Tax=Rhizobium sp. SSA_523 TaxID=2952477 RepID=UPI002090F0BE|nr:DUF930 domain-containing protein [Rhizobium sp. SSA_523]MCO5730360.1 DUF930 domain-containing protein [Rhizobium sp. SSA_523]WKC25405.1 DUF930 domain-containing protein [Rhizobium sp. SSA_523]
MQDETATQEIKSDEPLARPAHGSRRAGMVILSIALHLLIVLPFLVRLPPLQQQAAPEESVSVEIVPPPEPKPEPEPEPEAEPEPPKPPEPAPEEEPAAEEPPPPPPAAAEEPPPPSQEEASEQEQASPIPSLQPVFRFGEENRGPEQQADGNSAETADEPPVPPETAAEEQPPEAAEQTPPAAEAPAVPEGPATAEPTPPAETQPEETPVEETPPQETPQPVSPQEPAEAPAEGNPAPAVLTAPAPSDTAGSETDAAQVTLPSVPETPTPTPRPEAPGTTGTPGTPLPALTEAKRLYSAASTKDEAAMTAMQGIPRGERGGRLCASELQAQLRNGSPAYRPELIPAYTLAPGTAALEVGRGAFRAGGNWYDVRFRCEVNGDATEVTSFSYAVGERIPRSAWRSRGFPSF